MDLWRVTAPASAQHHVKNEQKKHERWRTIRIITKFQVWTLLSRIIQNKTRRYSSSNSWLQQFHTPNLRCSKILTKRNRYDPGGNRTIQSHEQINVILQKNHDYQQRTNIITKQQQKDPENIIHGWQSRREKNKISKWQSCSRGTTIKNNIILLLDNGSLLKTTWRIPSNKVKILH